MKKGKPTPQLPSGLVTFIFTDIVGSTQMKEQLPGDSSSDRAEHFHRLIKAPHDRIVKDCVKARGGFIVKGTGDGFLLAFADAEKAVLCALEIQDRLKAAAIRTPLGPLQIRVGINSGHAKVRDKDYTSAAVDKASRVESKSLPGQVYLSKETHALVHGKVRRVGTVSTGPHLMKGVGEEDLYLALRVRAANSSDSTVHTEGNSRNSTYRRPDVVLIGDPDERRLTWLKNLLAEIYKIDTVQATTLEQARSLVREYVEDFNFRIAFLADTLPFSVKLPKVDPGLNFLRLVETDQLDKTDFVCIVTTDRDPDFSSFEREIHLIYLNKSSPSGDPDREQVVRELGRLRIPRSVAEISPIPIVAAEVLTVEKIIKWDQTNRGLRRHIRLLSDDHDLRTGADCLCGLIRDSIGIDGASELEVKALGQGKSGAKVFRVVVTGTVGTREYVLKLARTQTPLEREVSGYNRAVRKTGYEDYRRNLPVLRPPVSPLDPSHPEKKFIVHNGGWHAIYYDFLGGENLGKFIDLESVLIMTPHEIHEKTKDTKYAFKPDDPASVIKGRLKVFGAILDGLCDIWYGNTDQVTRELRTIWKIEDRTDHETAYLPPYQLKRRVKGLIQDFLDSREAAIGQRLFCNPGHDWNNQIARVLTLVGDTSTEVHLEKLGGSLAFTLSPVHGDLNANNVLLWLKHDRYPFVIDFPSFQETGHCLQDFARLEVEIKLALLDRQQDSPIADLAAYDYSASQMHLWIEMEDQLLTSSELRESNLLRGRTNPVNWQTDGYKTNVDLCFRLVRLLRQKACAVQQKPINHQLPVPFAAEYLPALLYQSLQAISYPSLSIFKRMLAVYSAGSIFKMVK